MGTTLAEITTCPLPRLVEAWLRSCEALEPPAQQNSFTHFRSSCFPGFLFLVGPRVVPSCVLLEVLSLPIGSDCCPSFLQSQPLTAPRPYALDIELSSYWIRPQAGLLTSPSGPFYILYVLLSVGIWSLAPQDLEVGEPSGECMWFHFQCFCRVFVQGPPHTCCLSPSVA